MNKLKAALGGIVITSMVLIAGCGSLLGTKPNKPSKISVEGIDITTDARGNISANRKGVPFTPCKDDCNIIGGGIQVDSIKPVRLGAEAVVIVEYQIPVRKKTGQSLGAIGSLKNTSELKNIRLDVNDPLVSQASPIQNKSLPLLASLSTAIAQFLPPGFFMPEVMCQPVPIDVSNGCCTHVTVIDGNTNSLVVPAKEDPDCAAYFD